MSNIDVPQTTLSSTAVAPKAIETAPVNRASGAMQIASVLDQLAPPPAYLVRMSVQSLPLKSH